MKFYYGAKFLLFDDEISHNELNISE